MTAAPGTNHAHEGRTAYNPGDTPELRSVHPSFTALAPSQTPVRRRLVASPADVRTARHARDVADAVDCIRLLVRELRLAEQRTRAATGLSAAQMFLLGKLADRQPASLTDLAERTLTDRSSVAAVVERLEDAGFVATSRDAQDRRRVLVRITAAGARTLVAAPDAPTQVLLHALDTMKPADVRAVCAALGRLNAALGATGAPGMLFEDRVPGSPE